MARSSGRQSMLVPQWTEADQKALDKLVRKHGFDGVALGLRQIAYANQRRTGRGRKKKGDWLGIAGLLTRIFDNIWEGRPINDD